MIDWINIEEELPEYHKIVLLAYIDKDGTNKGITFGSLQNDNDWLVEYAIKGEDYDPELSVITHWFDYQENFNFPN